MLQYLNLLNIVIHQFKKWWLLKSINCSIHPACVECQKYEAIEWGTNAGWDNFGLRNLIETHLKHLRVAIQCE